ncbi:MAG: hypothetical protein CVU56_12430 [Deltaproteobacteria bacterium HGW-Deltaproteobacteria-14]|jgi:tetratricopeptide (TPR) repeat protein|nr:MAG: hypothetical protein CVU56_12430 [Deltaproteobacteria bacterium HGW-Deltaproteobacteria-14]
MRSQLKTVFTASPPLARGLTAGAALLTLALATGCGGGLSYTVPDKDVRTLTGADAEKVAAAKADVARAKAAYDDSKLAIATTTKDVAAAEKATEDAGKAIDSAESKVDRAESDLESTVGAAEARRDKAYAVAKATYEKAIAAAKAEYAKDVGAAKEKYGAVRTEGVGELKTAEKLERIGEAREAYQKALLDEREAREEEADAALWAVKADYELAKFDALMASRSKTGASVNEERLQFKEQAAERRSILLDRQREVVAYQKETEKAQRALEKLEGKPTAAPPVTTPPKEPAPIDATPAAPVDPAPVEPAPTAAPTTAPTPTPTPTPAPE